jgi:hypothetical protein
MTRDRRRAIARATDAEAARNREQAARERVNRPRIEAERRRIRARLRGGSDNPTDREIRQAIAAVLNAKAANDRVDIARSSRGRRMTTAEARRRIDEARRRTR